MGKIIKLFVGLIVLMIAGIIGVTALSNTDGVIGDIASDARNAAVNVALDASGAKNRVQDALESRVDEISAATGLSTAEVQQGIDNLAVQEWQVTDLPDDAQAATTFDGSAAGIDGALTTYADPSYVSVNAYGQDLDALGSRKRPAVPGVSRRSEPPGAARRTPRTDGRNSAA